MWCARGQSLHFFLLSDCSSVFAAGLLALLFGPVAQAQYTRAELPQEMLGDDGNGVHCPPQNFFTIPQNGWDCSDGFVYEHYTFEIKVPALPTGIDFPALWEASGQTPVILMTIGSQNCGIEGIDGSWQLYFDGNQVPGGNGQITTTGSSFTVCPWGSAECVNGICTPCSTSTTTPAMSSNHTITVTLFNNGWTTCLSPFSQVFAACALAQSPIVMGPDMCTGNTVFAYEAFSSTFFATGGCQSNANCPGAPVCCPNGNGPSTIRGCGINCFNCTNSCE
jgi:hypothetical protein